MATAKSTSKATLLGAAATEGESYAPTDTAEAVPADTADVAISLSDLAAPTSTIVASEISDAISVATATIVDAPSVEVAQAAEEAESATVATESVAETATPQVTTDTSALYVKADDVAADATGSADVAYTSAQTAASGPKLLVKYLDSLVQEVGYGTDGAAGIDLRACMQGCKSRGTRLMAGITTMFHTGIAVAIPEGYVGLIIMRSGKSAKEGILLANQVAVIDSDYRGEVMLPLTTNRSSGTFVGNGERVAQLVIVPCTRVDIVKTNDIGESTIGQLLGYLEIKSADQLELTVVEELPTTDRGDGGFGSTGSI